MRDISRYEKATEKCIPPLAFQRLVREIVCTIKSNYKFQAIAMDALQVMFKNIFYALKYES